VTRRDGAHRSRVLLDLIAPVLAAGARARAHGRPDHAPAGAPPRVAAGHPLDHAPTVDDRAADALATALADDYALTAREAQAARYLIQGCTNVALARALGISENTARHHTERVIAKLGVRSRAEVAWAAVGRIRTPAAGTAVVAR
jgi:DNA-binding CsgD family transcriptional regulator